MYEPAELTEREETKWTEATDSFVVTSAVSVRSLPEAAGARNL